MTHAITTNSLSKQYGRKTVLNELKLSIPQGSIYALVGANGAGKTTLIKLLMNIVRPTSGNSQVLGIDSSKLAGKHFTRIGYISENQEMPDWMTVDAMIDYCRSFYPNWDLALAQQLVKQFDLPLDRKLKHLSRGMRMKVAFATSLAYRPSLIVMDEPFSGLDPLVRDELIEGLLERSPEATILLSSHDLAEIESFSSHVGYLDQGVLIFSEEISVLTARFREVTVTLAKPVGLPSALPRSWLQPEAADCVMRFVHSSFDEQAARGEIGNILPSARDISVQALPLRAIFIALAKSARQLALDQKAPQGGKPETDTACFRQRPSPPLAGSPCLSRHYSCLRLGLCGSLARSFRHSL